MAECSIHPGNILPGCVPCRTKGERDKFYEEIRATMTDESIQFASLIGAAAVAWIRNHPEVMGVFCGEFPFTDPEMYAAAFLLGAIGRVEEA